MFGCFHGHVRIAANTFLGLIIWILDTVAKKPSRFRPDQQLLCLWYGALEMATLAEEEAPYFMHHRLD